MTCGMCGAQIPDQCKFCPACGLATAPQFNNPWMMGLTCFSVIALLFFGLAYAYKGTKASRDTETSCLTALEVEAHGRNTADGYVSGEIVNNCGVQVGNAFVEFTLQDDSGAQIGTAMDSTQNLGAGVRWKFKASLLGLRPAQIRIARLSAFH